MRLEPGGITPGQFTQHHAAYRRARDETICIKAVAVAAAVVGDDHRVFGAQTVIEADRLPDSGANVLFLRHFCRCHPDMPEAAAAHGASPLDAGQRLTDQFCIFGGAAQPARKAQPTTHTGGCAQAAFFDCAILQFGEGAQRKAALRVGGLIAQCKVRELDAALIGNAVPAFLSHHGIEGALVSAGPGQEVGKALPQQAFAGAAPQVRMTRPVPVDRDVFAAGDAVAGAKNGVRQQLKRQFQSHTTAHPSVSSFPKSTQWSIISMASKNRQCSFPSTV